MKAEPAVVVLTGSGRQHHYVARELAEIPNVSAVVFVEQPETPLLQRLARARRRFGSLGMVSRATLKVTLRAIGESARGEAGLARVLGNPELPKHLRTLHCIGVNSSETQRVLRALSPDILCVYGTYVVSDATLKIAKDVALNLHTGISPRYRGADCYFWPIHNNEPNWIGATVHACTADLDGGAIYGTIPTQIEAGDGLGEIFGRCVAVGSNLYKSIVEDLVSGKEVSARVQNLSVGQEYKVAMRGWAAELRVSKILRRRAALTCQPEM